MRVLLLAVVLVLGGASVGGCTALGFCCGRLSDLDETTRSDRRKVKKEIREEHREELEEAAEDLLDDAKERRDGDLGEYYAWLSKTLDLPKVWSEKRTSPGFVRAWRLTTLDGAYGDGGGFAAARLAVVPDWYFLVTAALEEKFEREFDKSDRDRLARDLWRGERWAIDHLDTGVAGIDLELTMAAEDMPPGFGPVLRVIGAARTDTDGLAVLALFPEAVPGNVPPMSYELIARVTNAPAGAPAVERDEAGHLHVRRGAAKGVVFVDADDVLDWRGSLQTRQIVESERFTARDYCVKEALETIAKSGGVAILSQEPDTREPVFRKGLVASGAAAVHPRSIAIHFAADHDKPELLGATIDRYRAALGAAGVGGLVTSDPALAESFAKATGARSWTLAPPKEGGWCAGLPGLVPPKK